MRDHHAPDETLNALCRQRLKFLQNKGAYRFSIDPILLANFIKLKKRERMLDIGTGCGIIPIYMAKRYHDNSFTGVEIQEELFGLAVKNVRLNGCNNVRIMLGDIRDRGIVDTFNMPFHVIAANPPYVRRNCGRTSPQASRQLARQESSLDLESLFAVTVRLLYTKGRVYLVYPAKRMAELISVATGHGIVPRRLRLIHPRAGEPANLFLIECVKGGGIELKVEPPLCIYDRGKYSEEVATYYS